MFRKDINCDFQSKINYIFSIWGCPMFFVYIPVCQVPLWRGPKKSLETPSGVYSYFLIFCRAARQKKHRASAAAWSSKPDVPLLPLANGFARKNKSAARRGVTFIMEVEHYAALWHHSHTHTHSDNHAADVLLIRAPERHLGPLFLC